MNQFHTLPVRRFSALSSVMPASSPITSGETQPVFGLKASAKPYLFQILSPYCFFMARRAGREISGVSMRDPAAAQGTTLPSFLLRRGGPPQALYPDLVMELVIPQ